MIDSTQGIVLSYTRYAEASIISHIYTRKYGLQSYIINQVRSKNNKGKNIFLQPLALVDIEVYHNAKKTLHRIKDFRINTPYMRIPFEPIRRSMAFFIAEVLEKSLRHEDKQDENLFDFLHQSFSIFDGELKGVQNFHVLLLFQLTQLLGIYPHFENAEGSSYFDCQSGMFLNTEPAHSNYMNYSQTQLLLQLKQTEISNLQTLQLIGEERTQFIEKMLGYYHFHLSGFSNIKSLNVLKDIFRDE